jgi:hypothetical protein
LLDLRPSYVRKNNGGNNTVKLLAAPVMRHARYGGKPIYYSDYITPTLLCTRTAACDFLKICAVKVGPQRARVPGTTSFGIHLAISGFRAGYFGRVVESGSHQSSLRLVLEHAIDAAAIDSTVLEMEFKKDPSIVEQIRTITTLGRSPAPPWVVHGSVSNELLRALRREFMSMDKYIHEVSKFWKTPGCFGSPGFWITSIMRFVKWRELPQAWNGHEDSPGDLRKVQNCGKSFKVLLVVQSRSLKSLRGKVPRDGIEPPTPAFSGRHGGFSLATDRDGFIAYHLIGKYLRRNREHSYTD